jgi:hypothetical protein
MTERVAGASPVLKARIAGAFYVLSILAGMTGAFVSNEKLSLAANLFGSVCYIAVTLILYDVFALANKNVSLAAALFSLAGCATSILEFLDLPRPGVSSLVFFGVYCLLLAYLIFTSRFLPGFLSVLLAIAGIGWLTFLVPGLGHRLFSPYLMVAGLVGEGSLTICLLVFGVNVERART